MKVKCLLFSLVMLMLAGTAFLLIRLQNSRQLGRPGVKVIAQSVYDEAGHLVGTNMIGLPPRVMDYTSEVAAVSMMETKGLPRDTTYGRRVYSAPDQFVLTLSVVMMGTDRGSIHEPEYCLSGQGWRPEKMEFRTIPIAGSKPFALPVKKIVSSKDITVPGGGKELWNGVYVYWFVADNEVTAKHGQRMWSMSRELLLTGKLQRWAYVACWAVCRPGSEDAAFARMEKFIAAAVPEFQLATGLPANQSVVMGQLP